MKKVVPITLNKNERRQLFGRKIGFKGRKKSGNGCTDITT